MKSGLKIIVVFILIFRSTLIQAENMVSINVDAPETVIAGNKFEINFEIQKNDISGFAKLEIFLPVGFKPYVKVAEGATCIIQNELVKLIWIELPDKPKFTVSISISIDPRLVGYKEIYGNFYYINYKERKKAPFAIVPFNVRKNENLNSATIQNSGEPEKEYKVVYPEKKLDQNSVYRIQVAAYKRKLSKDVLLELYGNTSFMKEELIDGLYKYTIGDFTSKDDADIFRQRCGVSGAFVILYENGVRK